MNTKRIARPRSKEQPPSEFRPVRLPEDLPPRLFKDRPERPSEIIIERYQGYWHQLFGSHHILITDPEGLHPFPENIDPMPVAKALKAYSAGPINVVVNL